MEQIDLSWIWGEGNDSSLQNDAKCLFLCTAQISVSKDAFLSFILSQEH